MFPGESKGCVASSVVEVEIQQPPTQGIKILRNDYIYLVNFNLYQNYSGK